MALYRAQLPDQYVVVEADSAGEAQDLAFAKVVRDLRPQAIAVWETGPDDEWHDHGEEAAA